MRRRFTLEQVKRELRARACQHCPLRTPGAPGDPVDTSRPLDCEPDCELFVHLPKLTEVARQLDPMLGSYDEVLRRRIHQTIGSIAGTRTEGDGRSSALNRHRRCVIRTLTELASQ